MWLWFLFCTPECSDNQLNNTFSSCLQFFFSFGYMICISTPATHVSYVLYMDYYRVIGLVFLHSFVTIFFKAEHGNSK